MYLYNLLRQVANAFTPQLYELIDESCRALDRAPDPAEALHGILRAAANYFGVSGAFVTIKESGKDSFTTVEWHDAELKIDMNEVGNGAAAPELVFAAQKDGVIVINQIKELPPELYDALYPDKISSIVLMPILAEGLEMTGIAGVLDARERVWDINQVVKIWLLKAILSHKVQHRGADENGGRGDTRDPLEVAEP